MQNLGEILNHNFYVVIFCQVFPNTAFVSLLKRSYSIEPKID